LVSIPENGKIRLDLRMSEEQKVRRKLGKLRDFQSLLYRSQRALGVIKHRPHGFVDRINPVRSEVKIGFWIKRTLLEVRFTISSDEIQLVGSSPKFVGTKWIGKQ
jgi:hypothetical protein